MCFLPNAKLQTPEKSCCYQLTNCQMQPGKQNRNNFNNGMGNNNRFLFHWCVQCIYTINIARNPHIWGCLWSNTLAEVGMLQGLLSCQSVNIICVKQVTKNSQQICILPQNGIGDQTPNCNKEIKDSFLVKEKPVSKCYSKCTVAYCWDKKTKVDHDRGKRRNAQILLSRVHTVVSLVAYSAGKRTIQYRNLHLSSKCKIFRGVSHC